MFTWIFDYYRVTPTEFAWFVCCWPFTTRALFLASLSTKLRYISYLCVTLLPDLYALLFAWTSFSGSPVSQFGSPFLRYLTRLFFGEIVVTDVGKQSISLYPPKVPPSCLTSSCRRSRTLTIWGSYRPVWLKGPSREGDSSISWVGLTVFLSAAVKFRSLVILPTKPSGDVKSMGLPSLLKTNLLLSLISPSVSLLRLSF